MNIINIQQKIEETQAELQTVIEQHNQAVNTKTALVQKATELQGALKVLQELNVDTSTDTEST
tara:strand:- start:209 stop:397 length:189 start_codon:yes stop_codon:yes gene_type:complete